MEQYYVPPVGISGGRAVIDGAEFAHARVTRMRAGEKIIVVDGEGNAYEATVRRVGKDSVECDLASPMRRRNEPGVLLTVAAAILKNPSKYDFLVEKVTEIGASGIIPLITERTIPGHAKPERWRKLALAAMKQSGRCFWPRVSEVRRLSDIAPEGGWNYVAHNGPASAPLVVAAAAAPAGREESGAVVGPRVTVLIGPEGGWSDEEVARCTAAGWIPLSLGERRLRSETAAVVAAALLIDRFSR